MTVYIVPDANVFLHCRWMEVEDYRELLGLDDHDLRIMACGQLLVELDRRKDDSSTPKLQKRAKQRLKKLKPLLGDDESGFEYLADAAPTTFDQHIQLDTGRDDDRYFAAILAQKCKGDRWIFVSRDSSALLRAERTFELDAVEIGDEWASAEEPSESDKRIRKLEEELARVTSRAPELHAGIAGDVFVPVPPSEEIEKLEALHADFVAGRLTIPRKLSKAPRVQELAPTESAIQAAYAERFAPRISDSDRDKFNSELDDYIAALDSLPKEIAAYQAALRRFWFFKVTIRNAGTATARDVRIHVRLPEWMEWAEAAGHVQPAPPLAPSPPVEPKPVIPGIGDHLERLMRPYGMGLSNPYATMQEMLPSPYVDRTTYVCDLRPIRPTKSRETGFLIAYVARESVPKGAKLEVEIEADHLTKPEIVSVGAPLHMS